LKQPIFYRLNRNSTSTGTFFEFFNFFLQKINIHGNVAFSELDATNSTPERYVLDGGALFYRDALEIIV
jgi:hypothetical protein